LLSRRIGREAARKNTHIFTYEPYAVRRPPGGFTDGRKQVVFYYHPHVDTEDAIYREDDKLWPKFHEQSGLLASPWRRRTADAWKQADLVLCASSFTKQSLVVAGMPEERGVVVPYGTSMERGASSVEQAAGADGGRKTADGRRNEAVGERSARQGALKLLFVGRNPLRKGLHHLLMAWNAAEKRQGDLLTIVCAAKPLEMHRLVEGRDDMRWLDSVSGEELDRLYAEADALVVPSLCEGFGHVYLEAMGRGCAVVGTRNSALPDIGDEMQGVFTVDVGGVEGLARLIGNSSTDPAIFRNRCNSAKQRAGEFTWPRFRQSIVSAVERSAV
jgi:glycosyltransferase involved in cell wall biosynthesis